MIQEAEISYSSCQDHYNQRAGNRHVLLKFLPHCSHRNKKKLLVRASGSASMCRNQRKDLKIIGDDIQVCNYHL
jgi:hypothetical protein